MEKYAAKCKNQNFMLKVSLQSSFCFFLKFGFVSSPSIVFCISKFSRIAKNCVEDTIIFSVKKKTRSKF